MYSQDTGKRAGGEAHYSDALAVKAIVPDKALHDGRERIAIVFNHRLNVQKTKEPFFVDFVGAAGTVQAPATLANSSTLILETPEYREPCVVTAQVYHGIHRRLLGQYKFEFLSRNDMIYRLLYGALDPINFMCEALSISRADVHGLDVDLAETIKAKAPEGFELLGIQHRQGTGKSDAEYPTLLHFACEFGLTELITVLLHYPGAYEACSMMNCNNQRPYNIAEDRGFEKLANDLRAFHDRGNPIGYVTMQKGAEEEDLYVKVLKDDGSYIFIPKEDHGLYVDMKDQENEDDGYYVRMCNKHGRTYYQEMKQGVCRPIKDTSTDGYIDVQKPNKPHDEDIYENVGPDNLAAIDDGQDGPEIYEDMGNGPAGHDEQVYEEMVGDTQSGASGVDEQFCNNRNQEEGLYMPMDPAVTEDVRSLMFNQGQTHDSFGYVKPTSNRPANRDAILFNRSASNAAAIRAKQIENDERKTKTLPAGTHSKSVEDAMKSMIEQKVESGHVTDREASEIMAKLGILPQQEVPPPVNPRRGSTSSKSSTSTTSSTGSSGISVSSHHELNTESADYREDVEDIHVSRSELLSQLKGSRKGEEEGDIPPPLPQPDYDQKGKPTGRRQKPRSRTKTAPVDERDVQALQKEELSPPPPTPARVQRRQSSPTSFQPKESLERGKPISEFGQGEPPKTAPRPVSRRPMPTPFHDSSRPAPPAPPAERISAAVRQSGVPVFPVQDPPAPQPPRRQPMPQPRTSR